MKKDEKMLKHCTGCVGESWDLPEGRTHSMGTIEHPEVEITGACPQGFCNGGIGCTHKPAQKGFIGDEKIFPQTHYNMHAEITPEVSDCCNAEFGNEDGELHCFKCGRLLTPITYWHHTKVASTPEWEIEFENEFASLQYAFAPEVYAEAHKQHLKDFIRKWIAAAQYRNAEYDEKLVDEARRDGYKAGADETRRSAIREFSEKAISEIAEMPSSMDDAPGWQVAERDIKILRRLAHEND